MLYEREKKYLSDYAAALAYADEKGEARGENRVLDLMAKGYSYEEIKEILKNKR